MALTDFHEPYGLAFLVLLVAAIVAVSGAQRRIDPTDLVLFLTFTAMALYSLRNVPLAAMVAAMVAASYIPRHRRPRGASMRARNDLPSSVDRATAGTAMLVVVSLYGALLAQGLPRTNHPGAFAGELFPTAMLERLDSGSPVRLVTEEAWAGLALYLGWPDVTVAYDTRADFYGPRYRSYLDARFARGDWRRWLDGTCSTHVLLATSTPLAVALAAESGWALVDEAPLGDDASAVLYVRDDRSVCTATSSS